MDNIYNEIASAINYSESITILGFRDDGLDELIAKLVSDLDVIQDFNKNLKNKVKIKAISIRLIERIYDSEKDKRIVDALGIEFLDKDTLVDIVEDNKRIVFVIEEIEKLKDPVNIIDILDQLAKQNRGKLTFIFLLEDVKIFLELQENLKSNSSFFDNVFIHPLEVTQEKENLEHMCKFKYGEIKDRKKLNKIFTDSYGHFQLYKRIYKSVINGNSVTLDNYARRLINGFDPIVLRIFRKLIKNVELSEYEQKLVSMYKQLGFIKDDDITIPLLKKYILEITPKQEITYSNESKSIFFDNIEKFSKNELNILKLFVKHENEVVDKEDIAKVIWGKEMNEKFSSWAIDQNIFRLRMKMDQVNLNGVIKTVHGKGYIFEKTTKLIISST